MLQNKHVLLTSHTEQRTILSRRVLSREEELAIIDIARNVCENVSPHLDFAPLVNDPSTHIAYHPTLPSRSYLIRRHTTGSRISMVLEGDEILRERELYHGDSADASIAWCRIHALLADGYEPTFNVTPGMSEISYAGGYVIHRNSESNGRWILTDITGRPIGGWQNPLQAELIARMDHNFGRLTQ